MKITSFPHAFSGNPGNLERGFPITTSGMTTIRPFHSNYVITSSITHQNRIDLRIDLMKRKTELKRNVRILLVGLITLVFAISSFAALAQRRGGGFGGGRGFSGGSRSSFGGGSFGGGRSSVGGGSFGSGRSSFGSGSSTNSGRSSFGSSSSSAGRSSFGRSGSFGSSSFSRSSSIPSAYSGSRPYRTSSMYYGGRYVPAYHYGYWSSYSFYWGAPSWYYWMPFHPAFYWGAPVYADGVLYPGGFSWVRLFIGLFAFAFVFWLIGRLVFRGRGTRYTSY